MTRAQKTAIVALTLVCMVWGSTFLLMEIGTDALADSFGTDQPLARGAFFLAVRFACSAAAMPLLLPSSIRRLDRRVWKHGFWLSTVFGLAFLFQIFGLAQQDVHPSQSAYLTSLYVVTTPLIAAVMRKRLPSLGVMVGVPLALLGAAFIAGPPRTGLSVGAWSTVACAVLFGVQILMTDYSTRRTDPLGLTFVMLLFTTLWMVGALMIAPGGSAHLFSADVLRPFRHPAFLVTEGVCALAATVGAVSLFNRFQKELDPSQAAIVYTSEPVFAALISVLAGRDTLTGWLLFGSTMILLANLAAQFMSGRPKAAAEISDR